MIKFYLIVLILLFPFMNQKSYSQTEETDTTQLDHELSIVIDDFFAGVSLVIEKTVYYGLLESSIVGQTECSYDKRIIPHAGLSYKRDFGNTAFRSKLSFGSTNYTSEDIKGGVTRVTRKISLSAFYVSLGYEGQKTFDKYQFFYGIEAFMHHYKRKSKKTELDNRKRIWEEMYRTTGIGISPLIGAKYFLTSRLSLSTEVKLYIEPFFGKSYDRYSESQVKGKTEISGFQTRIGPLGQISVNYHF